MDWTRVRARVKALRALPVERHREVFGATGGHGFALEEPLTQEELDALEAWLSVELPSEYRAFLTVVGAGGAGPAYGVFPVRHAGEGTWQWVGDGGEMTRPDLVATAFPDPVDPDVLAALQAERPDEEEFEDVEDFYPVNEAWEARIEQLLWTNERTAGAICLCHYGCARRAWLVVSGPQRGNIWADERCDDEDLEPMLAGDGRALSFAAWYVEWLANAEAKLGELRPL